MENDITIFQSGHSPVIMSTIHVQAKNDPHWEFPLHSHKDELELSLVIDGKANVYCNRKIIEVSTGDLIVKNCDTLHGEKSVPQDPIEQLCLSMKGIQVKGFPKNHLISGTITPILHLKEEYALIREMFLYIFKSDNTEGSKDETAVRAMTDALLTVICSLISSLPEMSRASGKMPEVIVNVLEYLDQNYEKKISLDDLSQKFYISSYYLSRKFTEHTGYSISQYLINRRMGEAERMLLFEDLSIREIAHLCGYSDLQYFYKTFKKYTGCTPVEFMEKYN